MSATFHIGNDSSSFITIDVLRRERPNASDYWDGNWVTSIVEIAAGPWKGAYRANFRTDEFARFRDRLQRLYDDKEAGAAEFESMERWLRMKVERSDRLGHVSVTGEAQPLFDKHNALHFALELDQSYLPAAIEGLGSVLKEFPVIGSPTD